MSNGSTTPEEAANIRARWSEDVETVRHRLIGNLVDQGIDISQLAWLSVAESGQVIQHWIDLGAQRYGGLALNPPQGSNARRGEFEDGVLPPWLKNSSDEVLLLFFRPSSGRLLARCRFDFVTNHLSVLARADGDGFGAIEPDLEGVLLVNVEDDLGESVLEIDAWGKFVRDVP